MPKKTTKPKKAKESVASSGFRPGPTAADFRYIRDMVDRTGSAIVIFTKEELNGADARAVEDRLIELGWDVINDMK